MPLVSKAQNRFVRWVDSNPEQARKEGIDPSFASKFIKDSHGQKVGNLPERVEHKAEGGRVFTMPPKPFRW